MLFNKIFRLLSTICCTIFLSTAHAEQTQLKLFTSGSYQQILKNYQDQPFMLVIWSLTCPSCVKDMFLLNELHKSRPELKMVMLATDESSESAQVQELLAKNNLNSIDSWIYADDNTQKLNYEIDPQWYGEQPRTYFFDAKHQRTGVSGVITKVDYETMLAKILKIVPKVP